MKIVVTDWHRMDAPDHRLKSGVIKWISAYQNIQIFATLQKFPDGKQNGRRFRFVRADPRSECDMRELRGAVSNCAM
jgi:hypothetical protein